MGKQGGRNKWQEVMTMTTQPTREKQALTEVMPKHHVSRTLQDLVDRLKGATAQFNAFSRKGSFTRTFGQSTVSLMFNLGGLLAGFIMISFFSIVSIVSWGLLIYPGILSLRGVLGGVFSGRLGSGLHTGEIKPTMRGNTHSFNMLWRALVVIAIQSTVLLSLFALLIGTFTIGLHITDIIEIVVVVAATMALSVILVAPITAEVSFKSFKHGLDPDVMVYPIMSTVADITVTFVYILTIVLYSSGLAGMAITLILALGLVVTSIKFIASNSSDYSFRKTLRETFLTIMIISVIVNITGSLLESVNETIGNRPEVYMIYPALIDTMGDVGSVAGSTATTKIAVGALRPRLLSIRNHAAETFAAITSGLVLCTMFIGITGFIQNMTFLPIVRFGLIVYSTGFVAACIMSIIAFIIAILTYKRGWDPDNFVIPIESSIADTITSAILLIVLILFMY